MAIFVRQTVASTEVWFQGPQPEGKEVYRGTARVIARVYREEG